MVYLWLGVALLLTLIELATKTLVTVWFIVSAIVSMILSLFVGNYFIQFLVFILLGTLLIAVFHDYLLKLINQKKKVKKTKNK